MQRRMYQIERNGIASMAQLNGSSLALISNGISCIRSVMAKMANGEKKAKNVGVSQSMAASMA